MTLVSFLGSHYTIDYIDKTGLDIVREIDLWRDIEYKNSVTRQRTNSETEETSESKEPAV